jgi:hypothetical protein
MLKRLLDQTATGQTTSLSMDLVMELVTELATRLQTDVTVTDPTLVRTMAEVIRDRLISLLMTMEQVTALKRTTKMTGAVPKRTKRTKPRTRETT